ncbi:hypothetical protein V6N13_143041 [Hibiscus sabdariffa]|uniref:Uncharacterized protein n=1 Tax=Hibiscus sabdariffa TaxID=183260 RepID=A0ABR2FG23_9ROSI
MKQGSKEKQEKLLNITSGDSSHGVDSDDRNEIYFDSDSETEEIVDSGNGTDSKIPRNREEGPHLDLDGNPFFIYIY